MASRRPTRPVYAPSRDSTCVAPDVVNCGSKEGMKRREPQVFGVCSLLEYLLFLLGQVSVWRGCWVFINTPLTIVELFQGQDV